jgi:hypothetical protein
MGLSETAGYRYNYEQLTLGAEVRNRVFWCLVRPTVDPSACSPYGIERISYRRCPTGTLICFRGHSASMASPDASCRSSSGRSRFSRASAGRALGAFSRTRLPSSSQLSISEGASRTAGWPRPSLSYFGRLPVTAPASAVRSNARSLLPSHRQKACIP